VSLGVSLIVRTKNQPADAVEALTLLRRQTVPLEIVVVDSGSTDDTLALAAPLADRVVELDGRYTPGRALNAGAAAAQGDIHGAFSAHCRPPDDEWLARSLAHYADPATGATTGTVRGPDGVRLAQPYRLTREGLDDPRWGYSNHASTWRAAVWEQIRFDETVPTTEDRRWSWAIVRAGWEVVLDPTLWVDMSHRWGSGVRPYFRRVRAEEYWMGTIAPVPPYGVRDVVSDWWSRIPEDRHSRAFHRVNPLRMAELAGVWAGRRRTTPP
jgi:rhamnosyltransferase